MAPVSACLVYALALFVLISVALAEYEPYTPVYKETPYKKPVVEVTAEVYLPKYEAPKYEAPAYVAPKYEAPKYVAPKYEAPKYEAPKYVAPKYEAPKYIVSKYEAPKYEAPKYTPKYEAPKYTPKYVYTSPPPPPNAIFIGCRYMFANGISFPFCFAVSGL
ncbi:pollen-specific leucine-rich repeat extensin-like protein 1 [Papaver somniferum]|uniref:pollen-specific leucine-rich repeat extensin-like protein 1 n=1 Tax=Papaver somniferum TaxID=3469 RepID=UPI000E6FB50F|nr:pollen-specific leucine-rich repeat extensin-like protein 1 [Papaver somniferum]